MTPNPWLFATAAVVTAAIVAWEWRGRDWWVARRTWDDFYAEVSEVEAWLQETTR